MSPQPTDLQPTLQDDLVLLRPLQQHDFDALYAVASDPFIWEQHPAKDRCQEAVFRVFFDEAMASEGALVVLDKATQSVIGSSRYRRPAGVPDAVEIGWSFLARRCWGGRYNGSVKKLMVEHAFGFAGHVFFLIDAHNARSRRAVEKLGGRHLLEPGEALAKSMSPNAVAYLIDKASWPSAGR